MSQMPEKMKMMVADDAEGVAHAVHAWEDGSIVEVRSG